jgi:hypothetical protein
LSATVRYSTANDTLTTNRKMLYIMLSHANSNARPGQQQQQEQAAASTKSTARKPPRKLEMRLPNNGQSPTNITFSAPFLDNTLSKLLTLQNRMLKVSNDIAASDDVDEQTKQEQFAQSAELSRIIALICSEKARQGA